MAPFEPVQLKHWIDKCASDHRVCREACAENTDDPVLSVRFDEPATSNFRLVDVARNCVVPSPLDTPYIALSYSGIADGLRLTTSNYASLTTDGALSGKVRREHVAASVCDAVNLVQAIGERYLWVDVLCLMHDDENDLDVGVSTQHAVFSGALFTIVAAASDGSLSLYDGVPGHTEETYDANLALSTSLHATQAWSVAEVALSKRAVLFTPTGVFFCCHEGTNMWLGGELLNDRQRDGIDKSTSASPINSVPGPVNSINSCLYAYLQLSQEFSRRTLRCDGDALRAFYGISRPLFAGMRTDGIEGLPAYYVNAFLLFKTTSPRTRRRTEFASFSWAGWASEIEWLLPDSKQSAEAGDELKKTIAVDIVRWLQNDSLVEWDELDVSSLSQRLRQYRLPGFNNEPPPPSNLAKFLEKHTKLFGNSVGDRNAQEIDSDVINSEGDLPYAIGGSSRMDGVRWVEDILAPFDRGDGSSTEAQERPRFPRWAFDLVESRGELDRLQRNLGVKNLPEKALRSWGANRYSRTQKLKAARGGDRSRPVPNRDTPRYREPQPADDDEQEQERLFLDKRAKTAREKMRTSGKSFDIPGFPPYSVLYGWSISLSLTLGVVSDGAAHDESALKKLSLLSESGNPVGSLYPDDIRLLAVTEAPVELIVLGLDTRSSSRDSLWVMCISCKSGIACRQGVGRVRRSALEDAVKGPELKRVFLG